MYGVDWFPILKSILAFYVLWVLGVMACCFCYENHSRFVLFGFSMGFALLVSCLTLWDVCWFDQNYGHRILS